MILYYSGANSAYTEQNLPEKSLGGFVSSTIVQNGTLNNIFSTISRSIATGNKRDVRLIVLKNTTGNTVSNIQIYIDNTVDNNHSDILLAAVAPAFDSCRNAYFEQIQSTEALPYQATLSSHNGAENAIEVDSLSSNAYIGIWLSRTIKTGDFPTANGATCDNTPQAIALLQNALANPISEDDSNLIISWE